ncbi:MAG: acyl--CoA ligase [Planctomycetes bacterium]|nr:acyl--CoA ligase [Planctomycetota bacterium]
MPLASLLEQSALRTPEQTALSCGDVHATYAELDARANRFAHALLERGLGAGERVALCLENTPEAVVSLFGAWKAGSAVVLLNPGTKPEKLGFLLEDSGARALVAAQRKLEQSEAVLQRAASLRERFAAEALPQGGSSAAPGRAIAEDELACLLYTSGSTGTPKGVMHSHRSLGSVTRSIAQYLGASSSDVVLSVLPLSFGYGLSQLLPTFLAGGRLVLERSFAFPQLTLQRLASERATGFAMVPTIASLLLQNDLSRFDLSALRYLTNAGAGIAPALLARLRTQFPAVSIFPMYGQTECIRASYLPPEEVERRPDSVGKGIPGQETWIVDERGERLGPGHTGELVVCGEHVMLGYWKQPEESARKLRPGQRPGQRALLTGDLFRVDEEGWYHFVARKDDIIKTRGEKVSPREVENVLLALEGVLGAAVVGVPDELLGQVVRAFVVKRADSGLDEKSVLRHCSRALEDFAVPKRVEFLDELPKTPNSKIDKQALLERIEAK